MSGAKRSRRAVLRRSRSVDARIRRLEPAAITGVMSREVANFRTFWKATTFSSLLEPTIYLLAFGLGLGSTIVATASTGSTTSSSSAPGWWRPR